LHLLYLFFYLLQFIHRKPAIPLLHQPLSVCIVTVEL